MSVLRLGGADVSATEGCAHPELADSFLVIS